MSTFTKASSLVAISRNQLSRSYIVPRGISTTAVRDGGTASAGWEGRQSSEHITNRDDHLNAQSSASKSGKSDRTLGGEAQSGATSEQDKGNQNEQAQKDHPEAPGPVIGMNDERGGMGHKG